MSPFAALQRYPMQWRRWAVLVLSLLLARYLLWRVSSTLNFSSPAVTGLSLLLLGCELVLLVSTFLPLWFSLAPFRPLKGAEKRARMQKESIKVCVRTKY